MWCDHVHLLSAGEAEYLMIDLPIARCNMQLAAFAVYLAQGETLALRSIKAATMKQYITAASKFCGAFNKTAVDFRKSDPLASALCPALANIFTEVARWEKMPDRREPFTIPMWSYLRDLSIPLSFFSKDVAIVDWFAICLFGGFRLSEWAQPAPVTNLQEPTLNKFGDFRAFCLRDISLFGTGNRLLSKSCATLLDPNSIHKISLCFRTQKNNDNGQIKSWVRNTNPKPILCFVTSMLRIIQRFFARHI